MSAHIALFGGSFNPPHLGHVAVLKDLIKKDQFDEIWVLPVFHHPWAKTLASFEDRLQMCHLAFDFLGPQIQVLDLEKENPSGYTLSLLKQLREKIPLETHLFLILGSDQKEKKEEWKDFDQIEKLAQPYYIPRSGYEASPFPEISSTEIRKEVKEKIESYKDKLPFAVYNYIRKRNLYS